MGKIKLDLRKPKHNEIIVRLTLMYYADGDIRELWDNLDGEMNGDDFVDIVNDEGTDLLKEIVKTFKIKTEDEIFHLLKEWEQYYTNEENLFYQLKN